MGKGFGGMVMGNYIAVMVAKHEYSKTPTNPDSLNRGVMLNEFSF